VVIGVGVRVELEGRGDIDSTPSCRAKCVDRTIEATDRRLDGFVRDVLACLRGERGVNQRGLLVADRFADDCIAVAHVRLSFTLFLAIASASGGRLADGFLGMEHAVAHHRVDLRARIAESFRDLAIVLTEKRRHAAR